MRTIDIRKNTLYFGGQNTLELAREFKTPLYVYNESIIIDRIGNIYKNFIKKYKNVDVYYASKAFLNLEMAKIIKEAKLGIDVASMGELFIALKAGFDPQRIMMHGNNKSIEELKYAIDSNVGRIVVDNYNELIAIESIANKSKKTVKVIIRISPMLLSIDTHDNISTGQADSKFGINLEPRNIDEVFRFGIESNYIEIKGIHFHVGSQIHTNQNVVDAIDVTFELLNYLYYKFDFICKELDVGGGFGIYYTSADKVKPIEYFTDAIYKTTYRNVEKYNLLFPKIIIEPGRYIVGEAAITLYTVGAVKSIPNIRNYAAVDGGMTDNLRVALYQAKYDIMVANKANSGSIETYTIVGKACESTDKMFEDVLLPKLETGDILSVFSTGAYENSLANNFNKILKPATILIRNNKPYVIQKREKLADLIKNDISLKY